MKFIIFILDGHNSSGTDEEMAAVNKFNEKLRSNGHWVVAAGITAPEFATLIDNRLTAGIISSGSVFKDKDHYSGFWIIETLDQEIAQTLALEGSESCNRRVGLRPFLN